MPSDVRNRSIRSAVFTSILSKLGTAVLQLLALPVAMRVLGWEEFGLYASVAGLLLTIHLFEIGLGPALTHGLSRAVACGDRERERVLSTTAFFLLCGLTTLAGVVLATMILDLPIEKLFGTGFVQFEDQLRPALWTGLGLLLVSLLFTHTDRVREGYMEVRFNNSWGAAGNLLAALAVAGGVWFIPSISYLLFAVFGSVVLAKVANTIQLWRARPWLVPSFAWFRAGLARWMITDSLAYAVFASVVNVVEFSVVQNLYGRVAGPVGVTGYSVLVTLTSALLGFVLMITTPMWPAVVDAMARDDVAWVRRTAHRLWLYVSGFALAAGLVLVVFGPMILPMWVGPKALDLDRWVLLAYAAYFLVYAWRHANHMLLVGTGRVRMLAIIQVIESALVLGAAWLGMNHGGLGTLLLAMAITIALITGWILPTMLRRELARARPEGQARQKSSRPGLLPISAN